MESKVHLRRCHICGTLNEASGKLVENCASCGKHLAPFYFFDESIFMGLPTRPKPRSAEGSKLPYQSYPPLWGLTAYW